MFQHETEGIGTWWVIYKSTLSKQMTDTRTHKYTQNIATLAERASFTEEFNAYNQTCSPSYGRLLLFRMYQTKIKTSQSI